MSVIYKRYLYKSIVSLVDLRKSYVDVDKDQFNTPFPDKTPTRQCLSHIEEHCVSIKQTLSRW